MMYLVCYDVETLSLAGKRRLRKVARVCQNYGQRAQKSVFECSMNEREFLEFENRLLSVIDRERDSLRIYRLDADVAQKARIYGTNKVRDFEKPIVV